MHKSLHLLGLLLTGPKTGYELHRIVRAHGDLYADLKKANVYYLLGRLAQQGYLTVQAEPGARGRRGERLIYSLTESGRARFHELLQQVLRTFEPVPSSIGSAVVFLPRLPRDEAIRLLEERRQSVVEHRAEVAALNPPEACNTPVGLAMDHLLALIDADLAWTDRTLDRLRRGVIKSPRQHQAEAAPSGEHPG
jgi:DNA-binding PadR family transcriptional regulator